jgi:hypothetical protein
LFALSPVEQYSCRNQALSIDPPSMSMSDIAFIANYSFDRTAYVFCSSLVRAFVIASRHPT